jgi:ABC-2 type transport system ATP-binding protein
VIQCRAVGAVLALAKVGKTWPGAGQPVLDAVGLDVHAGECVAVTGRNGAGKTTLLRIAGGLLTPDAGSVDILGRNLERDRTWCQRRLGFLSAGNSGLYGRLTLEQHLDFWSRLAMLPRRERRPAMAAMVERFALAELGGRRVDRLSMGQRQRLRLALGFLHSPEVVLLDEPENSLDDQAVALLAAALDELRERGGAAIVCSPSGVHDALAFDQRLALADGRLEPA